FSLVVHPNARRSSTRLTRDSSILQTLTAFISSMPEIRTPTHIAWLAFAPWTESFGTQDPRLALSYIIERAFFQPQNSSSGRDAAPETAMSFGTGRPDHR